MTDPARPGASGWLEPAPTLPPDYRLVAFDVIGSTQDEARRLAEAGADGGVVIVAREQTSGRGRHGRSWHSPPGNLHCSLLLRPDCTLANAAQLSFVAALAVADGLAALGAPAASIRLKWPNDLLLDGAKVAGILLESTAAATGELAYLIVGVGVDLAHHPQSVDPPATSLADHDVTAAVGAALSAIIAAWDRWCERWRTFGFDLVREAWLARAYARGQTVRLVSGAQARVGRFVDLDRDGAMLLDVGGRVERITAAQWSLPVAG